MLDEWIRKTKAGEGEKSSFLQGKNRKYVLLILICIGLLSILWPAGNSNKNTQSAGNIINPGLQSDNRASYVAQLETILSQIDGAGKVEVSMMFASDGEKIYATNVRNEKRETRETDSGGTNKNSLEENQSQDIAVTSGNPLLIEDKFPEVLGVLVVADGAKRPAMQEKLTNAAATLLNISAHKVRVMPRKGED